MKIQGKHIVVTGAAGGIGRALVERFVAEGARAVVAADYDLAGARATAEAAGASVTARKFDAGAEADVQDLVRFANETNGRIDVFFSNAGVTGPVGGPLETSNEDWDSLWRIHVMAHVWAARAVLPQMREAGEGYLLNTASAAGLLTQPSALPYTVTKHAAVALAEWLAITYGGEGIRVSCVCPQAVRTQMLVAAMGQSEGASDVVAAAGLIDPEDVARTVVEGMAEERLLILPHPEVAQRMAFKGTDHEGWLADLRAKI
ncbi:SDR family oxidoreductase [Allokutzneria sp. A3M-2-11 16]|uniref:SDR family oxidoreductase n=1 Tax=Allokutzneria sp. A3M-2-11 16 TaxID=2962043 RepID=UPI0020B808E4|nr:SDR family oxidoreductase [Allokutzneria sp. A3M-2-11 16]MCP3805571.1 SDR family oxidoreductase [Allokutzneria sp. A3M-2-11 16]